jgi:hypothetical protein
MSKQMNSYPTQGYGEQDAPADLKEAVRLRHFHGMLLGVHHFEMDQEYHIAKRRLANRLVTGPGVVCGLDVVLSDDGRGVYVQPGYAIDRCGREIVVPRASKPVPLPPLPGYDRSAGRDYDAGPEGYPSSRYAAPRPEREQCDDAYAHVVLCYHECPSDPTPVMAGDCETVAMCASGSVREKYEVLVREGPAPDRRVVFPDVIEGGRINYPAIVEYVTRGCRALPDDCCVPLANVRARDTPQGPEPEININCRPIVYNNRLLYHLLVSLVKRDESDY